MSAIDLIQQHRPSFRAPPQGRPFSPSAACSSLVGRGRTPLRRRLRWRSGAALLPLRPAVVLLLSVAAAVRADLLLCRSALLLLLSVALLLSVLLC